MSTKVQETKTNKTQKTTSKSSRKAKAIDKNKKQETPRKRLYSEIFLKPVVAFDSTPVLAKMEKNPAGGYLLPYNLLIAAKSGNLRGTDHSQASRTSIMQPEKSNTLTEQRIRIFKSVVANGVLENVGVVISQNPEHFNLYSDDQKKAVKKAFGIEVAFLLMSGNYRHRVIQLSNGKIGGVDKSKLTLPATLWNHSGESLTMKEYLTRSDASNDQQTPTTQEQIAKVALFREMIAAQKGISALEVKDADIARAMGWKPQDLDNYILPLKHPLIERNGFMESLGSRTLKAIRQHSVKLAKDIDSTLKDNSKKLEAARNREFNVLLAKLPELLEQFEPTDTRQRSFRKYEEVLTMLDIPLKKLEDENKIRKAWSLPQRLEDGTFGQVVEVVTRTPEAPGGLGTSGEDGNDEFEGLNQQQNGTPRHNTSTSPNAASNGPSLLSRSGAQQFYLMITAMAECNKEFAPFAEAVKTVYAASAGSVNARIEEILSTSTNMAKIQGAFALSDEDMETAVKAGKFLPTEAVSAYVKTHK